MKQTLLELWNEILRALKWLLRTINIVWISIPKTFIVIPVPVAWVAKFIKTTQFLKLNAVSKSSGSLTLESKKRTD